MRDLLTNKSVFEILDKCKGGLPDEEAQALVESIIGLMREKNITYECAYDILGATRETLRVMSQRLAL